ncbi:MAG: hypothetical protein AB8G17_01850 [Gammaproteobacteria bacterium]
MHHLRYEIAATSSSSPVYSTQCSSEAEIVVDKKRIAVIVLSIFIAFVFVQSLFFKFSDAPETQHIFGTLNDWTVALGVGNLFAKNGIFSQYVIGSAELVASILVLSGAFLRKRLFSLGGGLMATAIMSGAITFHLFTPLGVEVQGDSGTLFIMACLVWLSGLGLAWMHRRS